MQRANDAFDYFAKRLSDPQDSLHPKGGANGDGSQPRVFRVRCKRFGGTVSGLRSSELTIFDIVQHLEGVVAKMRRGGGGIEIKTIAVAQEVHQAPARALYSTHFHVLLDLDKQLDCSSNVFDPIGASKCKCRMNIELIENDLHFENKLRWTPPQRWL